MMLYCNEKKMNITICGLVNSQVGGFQFFSVFGLKILSLAFFYPQRMSDLFFYAELSLIVMNSIFQQLLKHIIRRFLFKMKLMRF
jgi:hypothetical protein